MPKKYIKTPYQWVYVANDSVVAKVKYRKKIVFYATFSNDYQGILQAKKAIKEFKHKKYETTKPAF